MTADTDTRRAPRRQVAELVPVTDMLAEAVVGRLGNISETGMLMLASAPMHDDALYQLQFAIPGPNGQPVALDVGAHQLWSEQTHAPGQAWVGFRFITLSREHRELLRAWIAQETSAV
ncbi:PilZ domain-containing protein [Stenotrophomonas rhizophila]|uniref:PilZ domain-containing protein n=1 Tax=Stenotrophomonas rhizophila TaxID=216778 RepID=UPI0004569C00|nr:PilZ domain-containing protein [Stenotrophomonas rhizophila]AHY57855.1 pilus assembly protein PilZ [Stenotrophomonas rhizophila]